MPLHSFMNTLQVGARSRLRSVALPYENASLGVANVLLQHGFIHNYTRGTIAGPDPLGFNSVGVAQRRLWLDIKYGNDDRPIMSHAELISKPSKRIFVNPTELLRLVTGRRAQFVNPLTLGEIAIVKTLPPGKALEAPPRAPGKIKTILDGLRLNAKGAKIQHELLKSRPGSRSIESYMEAREAVGKGLSGELVARIG